MDFQRLRIAKRLVMHAGHHDDIRVDISGHDFDRDPGRGDSHSMTARTVSMSRTEGQSLVSGARTTMTCLMNGICTV